MDNLYASAQKIGQRTRTAQNKGFYFLRHNKNPPAKPMVFKRRAKPYVTSHVSRGVGTVWHLRGDCYPPPINGLKVPHCQLFTHLVLLELISDIFLYLFCILSHCVHIIPFAPKLAVSIFVLQLRIFLVNHQRTFPLQKSHKARNRYLRRYLQQHVDMIRTYLCFYYCYLFPVTQLS